MIQSLLRSREGFLGGVVVLMYFGVGLLNPDFVSLHNLASVFNDTSILIILALGQMLVIITRCIDLSVAANVAFTGMVVAMLNDVYPDVSVSLLILLSLAMGALLGAINGLFIWLLKVPSIVITLGTMSIYRGMTFLISDGNWINSHQMSPAFIDFPRELILGLSVLSWLAILCLVLAFVALHFTVWGRDFYSSGGNPTAAFYSGVNVGKVQFYAFLVSGMLAGLCGYLWVSRFAVAYVDVANGFELQVVAACVIGGVSIMGGLGTVFGVLAGAMFIGIVNNALPIIGISPFWQMAISGAVIIVAVIANSRTGGLKGRIILREVAEMNAAVRT